MRELQAGGAFRREGKLIAELAELAPTGQEEWDQIPMRMVGFSCATSRCPIFAITREIRAQPGAF